MEKRNLDENKMKLLSVIVTVYNGEKHLEETLSYIRNSSYREIEVIIIDDGSVDCSAEVYKEFIKNDKRFRAVYQSNKGIVGARNRGIEEARGEYIVFCDQDDITEPFYYEKAIAQIEKDQSDLCICSTNVQDENGNISPHGVYTNYLCEGENIVNQLLIPGLLKNFKIVNNAESKTIKGNWTLWNVIAKRTLITENNLQFKRNVNFEDDYLFRVDLLLRAKKVSTIDYVGYVWRINLASKSHKFEYIDRIVEKQQSTRDYVSAKLIEFGHTDAVRVFLPHQICIDIIKILENEISIKRNVWDRKEYLKSNLETLLSEDVVGATKNLCEGELRYKLCLKLICQRRFYQAYLFNKIFKKLIRILEHMRVATILTKYLMSS